MHVVRVGVLCDGDGDHFRKDYQVGSQYSQEGGTVVFLCVRMCLYCNLSIPVTAKRAIFGSLSEFASGQSGSPSAPTLVGILASILCLVRGKCVPASPFYVQSRKNGTGPEAGGADTANEGAATGQSVSYPKVK